jgi:hypothetical protein
MDGQNRPPAKDAVGTNLTGGPVNIGTGTDGTENLDTNGIRFPERPARGELLYQLSYPGHHSHNSEFPEN